MDRLIKWILIGCFALGVGPHLARRTYEMAKAAVHAHQHDQMSYSKFTKALTSKP